MCGQRRQVIDIKKMRQVPHRRKVRDEVGSSIPRMGQKLRVVGHFSGGPLTTSQTSGKKGNLECRLENSRGTFHCLVSRSTNGRAPGVGRKNDVKAQSIPQR